MGTILSPVRCLHPAGTITATGKRAHGYLFHSDRTLAWDALHDDDQLRFPIAFTFRDARQDRDLEHFMVVKEVATVTSVLCLTDPQS